jgi:hypothetical protein
MDGRDRGILDRGILDRGIPDRGMDLECEEGERLKDPPIRPPDTPAQAGLKEDKFTMKNSAAAPRALRIHRRNLCLRTLLLLFSCPIACALDDPAIDGDRNKPSEVEELEGKKSLGNFVAVGTRLPGKEEALREKSLIGALVTDGVWKA